ncbi:cohesin domain-containing protein [Methanomassiliicoccus luminyensis]|uniref:cohesin domain-containing protein n=1 Tax=Methanomassiliicoccus luminyensis TaxID=1080712 RepID=UPI0009D9AA7C|nr:cohesin domain-containing protein [Methanomassiliicoccus luminyensis]
MTKHNDRAAILSLILAACFIAPLFAAGQSSAASDWPSVPGSNESPWISDALSPTIDDGLAIKWSVIGTTSGMSGWEVPSTAITVGDYAYYYDLLAKKLLKVNIEDGTEVASDDRTIVGMYNVPLTYANGKLFVPQYKAGVVNVLIYDANTMEKIGETPSSNRLLKGNGMQGPVTYYDGRIYLGTYGGTAVGMDFACFTENGEYVWGMDGGSWGYVMIPQFIEVGDKTYCVVASKGYGQAGVTDGGSTVYVLDPATGQEYSRVKISDEYVQGGISSYEGRVYVATQNDVASVTHIHSYVVGADGSLSDEKVWTSSLTGGTQSVPVIYNDRIYLGSGGATMGANRNIEVISIGSDGSMTSVYNIPIKTKSSLSLTTAYATAENDYAVYLYCTPYDGMDDNPEVCIIKDSAHQTVAKYKEIELPGEGDQYSFNSVTISGQGYLLFKSDVALWCVEAVHETDPILRASSVSGTVGDTVTVNVSIENNPGILGSVLNVTYDPNVLEVLSAKAGNISSNVLFYANTEEPGKVKMSWLPSEGVYTDGSIMVIEFKIKETTAGSTSISIKDGGTSDLDKNLISARIVNGTVTIASTPPAENPSTDDDAPKSNDDPLLIAITLVAAIAVIGAAFALFWKKKRNGGMTQK